MKPKFIINKNSLVMGYVDHHIELAKDHSSTIGGGSFVRHDNKIILYGMSTQYGPVTYEQITKAIPPMYHEEYQFAFSQWDTQREAIDDHITVLFKHLVS